MIYDLISNINLYKGISKNLDQALDFLNNNIESLNLGKTVVNQEKVFVNIMVTETKPLEELFYEYHKKYIDIHFVIEGQEKILVSNINSLASTKEYSEEDDYGLQNGEAEVELLMKKGRFCIVFPEDSHKPLAMVYEEKLIKKGIIKVLV